jgi:hypothetical protein
MLIVRHFHLDMKGSCMVLRPYVVSLVNWVPIFGWYKTMLVVIYNTNKAYVIMRLAYVLKNLLFLLGFVVSTTISK